MNKILFLLSLIVFLMACEEKTLTSDPAESFSRSKAYYDDGDYEIAINKLGEFKSRFPYSQFAQEAELLIADSHFQLGHFEEAAAAYSSFAKLHPKHPKKPFAMFRAGQCYWSLSPEDIDREQDFTELAVEQWRTLVQTYPDNEYTKLALPLIGKGERRLADSYQFAADFYCKQKIYESCAFRSMALIEAYPQFKDLRKIALKRIVASLDQVAKAKKMDPDSDKNIYHQTMSAEEIEALADRFRKQI